MSDMGLGKHLNLRLGRSRSSSRVSARDRRPEDSAVGAAQGNENTITHHGLEGLWDEAYKLLQKEHPDLLSSYESLLVRLKEYSNRQADEQASSAENDSTPTQKLKKLQGIAKRQLDALKGTRLRFTVNGKEVIVRKQAEKVVKIIVSVKDVISSAIASEPCASVAWAGALIILQALGGMFQQDAKAMEGFEFITDLMVRFTFIEKRFDFAFLQGSDTASQKMLGSIRKKTIDLYCQIYKYHMRLAVHYSHSTVIRYPEDLAGALGASNWSTLLTSLKQTSQEIQTFFETMNSAEITTIYHKISHIYEIWKQESDERSETRRKRILQSLKYSEKALFDYAGNAKRSVCLENTQVLPLQEIREWCEDADGKTIFWLHGMAGTGKSTVARTIAWALHDRKWTDGSNVKEDTELVGSFFFQQGDETTSTAIRLLPTLAWCLVYMLRPLEPKILDAVESDPNICHKLLSAQWDSLIFGPLSLLSRSVTSPKKYVIVIDSLDECEDDDEILPILKLFEQLKDLPNIKLRILISSRAERRIENGFKSLSRDCYIDKVLEKIQPSMGDIMHFLIIELAHIAQKLSLSTNWPSLQEIQKLNEMSDGLFVYASTACRFLDDEDYYESRLETLLRDDVLHEEDDDFEDGSVQRSYQKTPQKSLDDMYAKILKYCVKEKRPEEKKDFVKYFNKIVGSIMLLLQPLSHESLGHLLFGSYDQICQRNLNKVLSQLHSVIEYRGSSVVPVHLSFRDFLLDKNRCKTVPKFWIDQQMTHYDLLKQCFKAMEGLKQDICELKAPASCVSDLSASQVDKYLPSHAQYACRYWVNHLTQLDNNLRKQAGLKDTGSIHEFMQFKLLFWLEALSLMKELPSSISILKKTARTGGENPGLSDLIMDATRFVLSNRQIIQQAPLQIYCSALVFSPIQSLVRRHYSQLIPSWIKRQPVTHDTWTPEIFALEGHADMVRSVVFSSDGTLIASKSLEGTILVWDTLTGVEKCRFKDKSPDTSRAFALSHDGSMLASRWSLGVICLRAIATGEVTYLPCEKTTEIRWLAFFPDGKRLVCSGRKQQKDWIEIWDVQSKTHLRALHLKSLRYGWQENVGIDDRGNVIFYNIDYYECGFIYIDMKTGSTSFEYKSNGVNNVLGKATLATDGTAVALAGLERIDILDTAAGTVKQVPLTLQDFASNKIARLAETRLSVAAISSGGKMVALGYEEGSIVLIDAVAGTIISILNGHFGCIHTLSFSPDSLILASGSSDRTARLWHTNPSDQKGYWNNNRDIGTSVRFLADTDIVLAGSYITPNYFRQLWRVSTGKAEADRQKYDEVQFSHDGGLVCALSRESGKPKQNVLQVWAKNLEDPKAQFVGLKAFAISEHGHYLACIYEDVIHIMNTTNWKETATLAAKDATDLCFSPNSAFVVWTERSRRRVWHLQTRSYAIITCDPNIMRGTRIIFSENEKLVAFHDQLGVVSLWNTAHGANELLKIETSVAWAFSPDGFYLLTSRHFSVSEEKDHFEVWDTQTGSKVSTFPANLSGMPFGHAFTISHGNLCAVYFAEEFVVKGEKTRSEIRVWDLTNGEEKGRLTVDARPERLTFSADGLNLHCSRGHLPLPFLGGEDSPHDLYVGKYWVRQGSQNMVWLPPAYRGVGVAVREDTIAFASGTEWAEFMGLDLERTPYLQSMV